MLELFGKKKYLCLDEIQNITGWELFVNRMLRQGYKVFITGSNANLLSRELGTHLTGRHIDIELYPFSFSEYLNAHNIKIPKKGMYSTEEKALLSKHFKKYLLQGGMPEVIVFSNEAILTQVVNDILQRDIVNRYNIRKPSELKTVLKFLIANTSHSITYRSIRNNFKIQSANTIQKYIEYAEETYLVFSVRRYEKKLKQFDKNPKKIYCVDNGIITKTSPTLHERQGALLENLVALQLRRGGKEFYYYRGRTDAECDFVVPREKQVLQVCYQLRDDNREREIKGLSEAINLLSAKHGFLLTLDQEDNIVRKNKNIIIQPVWQWLLENDA
jgi:predicted AAA+ superfamily ATPase